MKEEYVCRNCGYIGEADKKVSGSFLVEVLLWCLFILPGIIYSISRYAKKVLICPECEKETLIPTSSKMGIKLVRDMGR
ncbi:MAG: hypothetical protein WCV93_01175 [Candidatus Shapirobacteria bacterium]